VLTKRDNMKYKKQILILLITFLIGCNQSNNDEIFIKENPNSKKYIDFLEDFKNRLLDKEARGLKFGWILKVYCEETESQDGFTAKAYVYKDKMRLDAIFKDCKKWIRIYDGNEYYEFVNGEKSTEFLERWGDSPPEKPALCPILSQVKNFREFHIDSAKNEARLDVMIDNKRNTFVFPINEPEKFYTLYYNNDNQTVYKKEYGINYLRIGEFILPSITISEIAKSNWCNGGKRFVKKYNFDIDFNWRPDTSTYKIKNQMEFIENFSSSY
jgi:hypothetical protein